MRRFLTFPRLALLFSVLFALSVGTVFLFDRFWIGPEQACEQSGRWWYPEERQCLTPIYLPDITGRPAGVTREQASDEANRELLAIERRLAAEDAARDAAIQRQREELQSR
ncbi:hypothetical protein IP78_00815 [Brevundimonas sp. AAP58]|uniref:hypothetical protein n=1 Tax=Brevundimonas sp. AAP58 TaxID=1523422 RepID=UPI0006B96974|nr:hypothetical protein [Brevundimonas sp. AAP58]KPF84685.1 hypothetical protein IP78_00815 [Brevundimonas sp. AAP58]